MINRRECLDISLEVSVHGKIEGVPKYILATSTANTYMVKQRLCEDISLGGSIACTLHGKAEAVIRYLSIRQHSNYCTWK